MKVNLKSLGIILSILISISILIFSWSHKASEPNNLPSATSQKKIITPTRINSANSTKHGSKNIESHQPAQITPDLARKILKENDDIVNLVERARKCGDVIQSLCLAGFQEEAWSLISEAGQGAVRNKELEAYFSNTKLTPDQFSEKYQTLRPNYESIASLSCWLKQMNPEDISVLLDPKSADNHLAKLRVSDSELFSGGVCSYIQLQLMTNDANQQEKTLTLAYSLLNSGVLAPVSVQFIIDKVKFEDSFQKWDYINLISNPNTSKFLEPGRSSTISAMVRRDPIKAIEILGKSDNMSNFQQAVGDWLGVDSTQAINWYTNNKSSLNTLTQSAAASAFFTKALNVGEIDSAEKWAQEIQDPKLKADALKSISDKVAASAPKN